jgi:hypothetical protein
LLIALIQVHNNEIVKMLEIRPALSSLEEVRVASGGDRVPVHLMNDT